ncbi:hypothetical protein ACLOJK_001397 [Asimina triloba]
MKIYYFLISVLTVREGVEQVKALISDLVSKTLRIRLGHSNATSTNHTVFRNADLGCSVGSNAIAVLQIILEAVERKYKSGDHGIIASSHHLPEFQVFFNDNASNDFNTLFRSLPLDRHYLVAGVPGSFHGRLFPKATINIIHSSFALHWLSKLPEEVLDRKSNAWNGGEIFYAGAGAKEAVVEAYLAQFSKEMECFLSARAVEMVDQGLMFLLFPCRRDEIHPSESILEVGFSCLGSCLNDMANQGIFDQDKVDTFNLPIYIPSPLEVKNVVEKDGRFSIEMLQVVAHPSSFDDAGYPRFASVHVRAALEGIISKHFGDHIIDDLFERFDAKLEELFNDYKAFRSSDLQLQELFLLLKCIH